MYPSNIDVAALVRASLLGTVLQVTMVLSGHSVAAIAQLFAVLGIALSLLAGVAYAWWAEQPSTGAGALGGALAGGICALLGIAISVALGDVPPAVLGFGTASSAISGALGGSAGAWLKRRAGEQA